MCLGCGSSPEKSKCHCQDSFFLNDLDNKKTQMKILIKETKRVSDKPIQVHSI